VSVIDDAISAGLERARLPGAVALVGDRDGLVYAKAFGTRGVADATPMSLDTLFWLASMTKAVTSVAAMQLVEQERLALDEPIGGLLPELAQPHVLTGFDETGAPITRPATRAITLRHLLTHTAGFGYDFMNADMLRSRGENPPAPGSRASLNAVLLFDPGERWEYGVSTDWVGLAVEAASGQDLGAYFATHIFAPLGMGDTGFGFDEARAAPLHTRLPEGGLAQIPSLAASLDGAGYLSGGGGLSGTGGDYMRFLRMILNGGALDGRRLLETKTVEMMAQNQIGDLRAGALGSVMPHMTLPFDLFPDMKTEWGLGFLINPEPIPGRRAAGSLAWAGLGNTHYWIDPTSNRAGLLLTQTFPFGDPAVMDLVRDFETAAYGLEPDAT
jgi:CubicO group peptidase (beta-lactamase class C family)